MEADCGTMVFAVVDAVVWQGAGMLRAKPQGDVSI
jgi:hypothetical protein